MIYERMVDVEFNLYKEVTHDHLEKFGVDGHCVWHIMS
jgi:hypothetical protein